MYAFDFLVFLLILYGTISKKKRPFPQSVTFFAQVGFEVFADAEYPLQRSSGYFCQLAVFDGNVCRLCRDGPVCRTHDTFSADHLFHAVGAPAGAPCNGKQRGIQFHGNSDGGTEDARTDILL